MDSVKKFTGGDHREKETSVLPVLHVLLEIDPFSVFSARLVPTL